MKTTLNIDETVMRRLKQEAARRRTTMSALVETALRGLFEKARPPTVLPPLPRFDGGGCRIDIADREALYNAMEGR